MEFNTSNQLSLALPTMTRSTSPSTPHSSAQHPPLPHSTYSTFPARTRPHHTCSNRFATTHILHSSRSARSVSHKSHHALLPSSSRVFPCVTRYKPAPRNIAIAFPSPDRQGTDFLHFIVSFEFQEGVSGLLGFTGSLQTVQPSPAPVHSTLSVPPKCFGAPVSHYTLLNPTRHDTFHRALSSDLLYLSASTPPPPPPPPPPLLYLQHATQAQNT
ncbi:hypothetical protein E2C01_031071 [Portunus trituberculatus]|uniref:Uncharacterized protein n=1 Tax=Portunus trituberculatus TaxID=210409 RepID=A0A5B7EZ38_PORTR|nr:hypothetical protein [Portunus trituberculatus]